MSISRKKSNLVAASAIAAIVGASVLLPAASAVAKAPTNVVVQSRQISSFHASSASRNNAKWAAQQYIQTMPFSRSGLIQQLVYEGYSKKDSKWAVDHIGANWNTQAKLMAKQYLKTMPFSRSGLIDQLVYEGFTLSQAKYGVRKAGL